MWVFNKKMEIIMETLERKILRKIFGTIKDDEDHGEDEPTMN